jgi:hypothetical protein
LRFHSDWLQKPGERIAFVATDGDEEGRLFGDQYNEKRAFGFCRTPVCGSLPR